MANSVLYAATLGYTQFAYCFTQHAKVSEIKEKLKDKTGLRPDEQRLLYGGKELQDDVLLSDYGVQDNSVIFLVLRLPGGASQRKPHPSLPRSKEECCMTYDTGESLKMPCGHAMSPEGLIEYCRSELEEGKQEVKCPVYGCEQVWPLDVLKKYSCADQLETWFMEMKLSSNVCVKSPTIVECPQCKSLCEPRDPSRIDVQCSLCARKGKTTVFCYKCLHTCKWKGRDSKYVCENPDCPSNGQTKTLNILQETPEATVIKVRCPSIRACPVCGTLIEHTEACKHMTCRNCGSKFCFLCLKVKPKNAGWPCGYAYTQCEVAPRQTTVSQRTSLRMAQ